MKNFFKKFKKYAGIDLIKQYHNAGVLPFACIEMLRLGTSKTALELLRSTVQLKVQQKLFKKYKYVLDSVDKNINVNFNKKSSCRKIWICWLQGIENAPMIVKKCVDSIIENFKQYEVIIITEDNYHDYVKFPDFIQEKIDSGVITKTHFSDLLRLELLINYGGIWMDSTVFMTGCDISNQILDADLFMFQELKPGRDGHSLPMSSWFMVSKPNNKILYCTRALLYEYWKKNNKMIDYFLIHHFINISKMHYKEEWDRMPKYSNGDTHLLLLELFNEYNDDRYTEIKRITCIHKLSYKFTDTQVNINNTFYKKIFESN